LKRSTATLKSYIKLSLRNSKNGTEPTPSNLSSNGCGTILENGNDNGNNTIANTTASANCYPIASDQTDFGFTDFS
jgi:hypothetical protein